jgi:crotonobetainyl-CoA:carnitine CoA-transferase CaiB-like acyl-CoA transferase
MAPIQREHAYFFNLVNRNKRSLKLDWNTPQGRELLLKLVQTADVWVESYRPGVMAKMGLDYETLKIHNPRLIYCSLTGFGQTGPLSPVAGHDLNFVALSGVLDQMGTHPDQPPALANYQLGDLAGGALQATIGILAALLRRHRTGEGSWVDVSMFDGLLAQTVIAAGSLAAFGQNLPRGGDLLTGGMAFYGLYRTADNRYMAVGAIEFKFWQMLCTALQRPDLVSRHIAVGEDALAVRAELEQEFAKHPLAHWAEVFAQYDCCVTPVLEPQEAYKHPHAQARGLVQTLPHPSEGDVHHLAYPVKFSGWEFAIDRHAPRWGQHSREVAQQAGYSSAEIEQLLASGAIFEG